jgi:hypothetical protein
MKLLPRPAAVGALGVGGSILVSNGWLLLQLPPMLSGLLIGTEFAALVVIVRSVSRRQERAQQGAVQLLGVLRDMRGSASVVIRANGHIEAEVSLVKQEPSSEALGSSEPQVIYQGELQLNITSPGPSMKTGRRELETGPGTQATSALESSGTSP